MSITLLERKGPAAASASRVCGPMRSSASAPARCAKKRARFIGRTGLRWHGVKTCFALMASEDATLDRGRNVWSGVGRPDPNGNALFGKTNDAKRGRSNVGECCFGCSHARGLVLDIITA